MKNESFVIGIDFGTLSARAILVNTSTGEEVSTSVFAYPHGVMYSSLPSGKRLRENYALQHPDDYLIALKSVIDGVISESGIDPTRVKGLGIDFTACTLLPIDKVGEALCMRSEFSDEPHAYVKLWKHHGAAREADEINALAIERGETWLDTYGGTVSCEWAFPKIYETLRCAEEVYYAADSFVEAADWLSLLLTGKQTRSATFAGYKWLWNSKTGYPSNDFLKSLDSRLDGIVGTKISENVLGIDKIAGYVDERGSRLSGLPVGCVVAIPMLDAHAAMPALNITGSGELMVILGTSGCHILNSSEEKEVKGICGYVKDGVVPELYTYEAGQAAVGDIFDWFAKNCVPASYEREAAEKNIGIHKLLREKAMLLGCRENGLVALDWWNGNRSVLVNPELKGMIHGFTLLTKPEEIYRALIEATAFGLKVITERYGESGVSVDKICAAGGIAMKDEMMMQIYADVLDREINIAASTQAAALGSAIYASVAAGEYSDVVTAAEKLSKKSVKRYSPIPENVAVYKKLYEKYKKLHDYFAELGNF
ncbi:MAG: ribulokinase [Clostridia bacterium]|nr:ribulokinase [Clostridia bacterium]